MTEPNSMDFDTEKASVGDGEKTLPGRPSPMRALRSNAGAIIVMVGAVALQVVGAIILKTIADHRVDWAVWILVLGVFAVICLNVMRLGVWGIAHHRFPLSTTVPLSSLFFPAMLAVAAAFGESIGPRQIMGAIMIMSGSVWLSMRVAQ